MGTYMGSPWGFIRGKIGDQVGGVWKGIEWVRVRVLPVQRGSLELFRMLKDGLINPERFSFKQFNIRRLVFQVLGWIGRTNMSNLIYPVWEALCSKRKWALTGINAFISRSAPYLWDSLPNQDEEYNETTNKPDMKEMLVSDGDLEASPGVALASYAAVSGAVSVNWDAGISKNGKDTDFMFAMVYAEPIVDPQWRPNGYLYGTAIPIVPPGIQPLRGDVSWTFDLPVGLTGPLFIYVFFRDAEGVIGYSPSVAYDVSIV